jgi:hypothetical protein
VPGSPRGLAAQRRALQWLEEHGGDGVWVYNGLLIMAQGEYAPARRVTWEALELNGKVESYEAGGGKRIRLTRPSS